MSGGEASQDPFEQAWREVEARWADDAAHRKFIAFCAAQGALGEAGRRYREVRDRDAVRSEEARRRIDAVLGAAMQTMEVARSVTPRRPKRFGWLVLGLGLFLALYASLSILRARSH